MNMTTDYQALVNEMMTDGRAISGQHAGEQAAERLNSVDALAGLSPQDVTTILAMYNQQNDSEHLPDATITTDANNNMFINFGDPEVPTSVQVPDRNHTMDGANRDVPLPKTIGRSLGN